MIRDKSLKTKLVDFLIGLVLLLAFLSAIMPFAHQLAISFSGRADVQAGRVGFWPLNFTLDNYLAVTDRDEFGAALLVSIVRILVAVPATLLVVVLTAYALAMDRIPLPGRKAFIALMIFANLFQVGLIPRFLTYNKLQLTDNYAVLILPLLLSTFNVVLAMNHFRSIPYELIESAMMDGATHWQIISKVMIPLSTPVLATISLFVLVQHWNSWFDGVIYLRDIHKWPLGTYLYSILTSGSLSSEFSGYRFSGRWPEVSPHGAEAAMILFAVLPVLIAYPLLQRYIISGMTLGSVKE